MESSQACAIRMAIPGKPREKRTSRRWSASCRPEATRPTRVSITAGEASWIRHVESSRVPAGTSSSMVTRESRLASRMAIGVSTRRVSGPHRSTTTTARTPLSASCWTVDLRVSEPASPSTAYSTRLPKLPCSESPAMVERKASRTRRDFPTPVGPTTRAMLRGRLIATRSRRNRRSSPSRSSSTHGEAWCSLRPAQWLQERNGPGMPGVVFSSSQVATAGCVFDQAAS